MQSMRTWRSAQRGQSADWENEMNLSTPRVISGRRRRSLMSGTRRSQRSSSRSSEAPATKCSCGKQRFTVLDSSACVTCHAMSQ